MGIPTVHISSVVDVAMMVGVSRLIRGFSITSPLGDPELPPEREKAVRRLYIETALRLLQEEGEPGKYTTIQ